MHWHYPLEKPHFLGGRSGGAIRAGDWKLIEYFDNNTVELFHLENDPGEKTNLAGKNADRVKAMRANLDEVRSSTGAFRTSRNPDFNPNDFRKW